MATRITTPSPTGGIGISTNHANAINADNAAPLAPINMPATGTSAVAVPPKGPDGKPLILNRNGTAWVQQSPNPSYSDSAINSFTNNGTDTSDILHQGLDILDDGQSDESLDNLSQPQSLNNSQKDANISSAPSTFTGTSKLFGQQLWEYKVALFNHRQHFIVPTKVISSLCVEDDLLSWPIRGYVVIENRLEAFERSEDFNSFYYLRSDARDEILVEMYPVVPKGTLPDKIWKIDLEAVIYDVEDMPHPDMSLKVKKLYFWDKKFQHLLEKNIQWSTATGKRYTAYTSNQPCPTPIAHSSDIERSMFTGEAIASLLYEAGYESYIDFNRWNWGKSKILFAAKADWTIWDCIQYILQQQVSDDGKYDICLLQWNRGDKKWNMQPVWRLFEKAGTTTPGDLQVEHMFFEETMSDDTASVAPPKAPLNWDVSYTKDIKMDDYNKIRNYRFSQTSGLDNSKAFLTRPVYSHWHKNNQFDIDVNENEISNVKERYFSKNYVAYVLSPGKYPVMTMNQTKIKQKSIDPQFSPISTTDPKNDRWARSMEGRGKILYAGIFLNQNLVVRMHGSTHRLAGTFIGVDRLVTGSNTIYDYQLCGQYLVSNVKHIIEHQKYVNDITMVKIHAYNELPVNEGVE